MTEQATASAMFAWDRDYRNLDQVRPYLEEFTRLHDEMHARDQYPYNSSFRGLIPGLAGSPDEDTGIYLLQTLHEVERLKVRVRQFINSGGYHVDLDNDRDLPAPGVLVNTAYCMGGTGWAERRVSKAKVENRSLYFKEPRQKLWRRIISGGKMYFRPDPT